MTKFYNKAALKNFLFVLFIELQGQNCCDFLTKYILGLKNVFLKQ